MGVATSGAVIGFKLLEWFIVYLEQTTGAEPEGLGRFYRYQATFNCIESLYKNDAKLISD
jgi:hypothetical protein